jgi:hypothetical protein
VEVDLREELSVPILVVPCMLRFAELSTGIEQDCLVACVDCTFLSCPFTTRTAGSRRHFICLIRHRRSPAANKDANGNNLNEGLEYQMTTSICRINTPGDVAANQSRDSISISN